jgi:hypothetical protein
MKKYSWILVLAAMAPLVPVACGGGSTSSTSTGAGGSGGSATTGTNTTGTTTSTGSNTTGTTTSAASGTGGSGPDTIAACDAPASAPSMGKCYMPSGTTSSSAASSSAASSSAASSSASSGTGGGPDCSGFFNPGTCGTCAEGSCCAEVAACKADADCVACITGTDTTKCVGAAKTESDAVNACLNSKCAAECAPAPCNPITNEGCDTANGWACDHGANGFTCFAPTNDVVQCDVCDEMNGPYCEAGHTCLTDGYCAAYCCDDGDCGTGTCDKTILGDPDVGVCVKK